MSLRIDIPVNDITLGTPGTPPARLAEYTASPKTPEDYAADMRARDERVKRLHELHLENIKANAKRANERAKEGVARKLRLEAAKVEKASAALERAKSHANVKMEESFAKRDANKAKRDALLQAVRDARKERQNERAARQLALAALEDKACSARAKMVMATSQKGRAAVKHALAVSAALKAKERVEAAEALKAIHNKQMEAEARRQEVYTASHTIVHQGNYNYHTQRLHAKLNEEASTLAEKRYKYAKSVGNAIGKRAARIDYISHRAKMANAHAKEVAEEMKTYRDEVLPKARKHSLAVRMQGAEVNRMIAQKSKLDTVTAIAAGLPLTTTTASPSHTPQPSLPSSPDKPLPSSPAEVRSKIYWLGPDGGYGRLPVTTTTPFGAAANNTIWAVGPNMMIGAVNAMNAPVSRKGVLLIIPSHTPTDRKKRKHSPPAELVSRLLFNPRILLATAKARHAAAAGRRTIARAYKQAHAAHFGTVRVAQAAHRRTARHELVASLLFVSEERGAQNAEAHIRAVAAKARLANHRVIAAAMRRSAMRIDSLNRMMASEEKRQLATIKHTTRLLDIKANRYDKAAQVAARARLAARDASRALKAASYLTRENETETRRAAIIDYIIAKARACSASIVPRTRRAPPNLTNSNSTTTTTSLANVPPPKISVVFHLDDDGVPSLKIDTSALPNNDNGDDDEAAALQKRIDAMIRLQNAEADVEADLAKSRAAAATFDEKPIVGGLGGGGAPPTPNLSAVVEEVSLMRKSLAAKIVTNNARNEMRSRAAKQAAWTRFTEACAVVEAAEKAAAEAIAAIHWGHLISATQMEALTRAAAKAAADSAKKTETLTSLRTLASKVVKAADVKAANSLPNLRTLASKILKAADVKAAKREQKKEKDDAMKARAHMMRLAHAAHGKAVEEAAVDLKASKLKAAEERAAIAILNAERAAAEAAAAQYAVRTLAAAAEEEDEAGAIADEALVVIGRAMTVFDKENASPEAAARLAAIVAAEAEEEVEWSSEEEEEEDYWEMV